MSTPGHNGEPSARPELDRNGLPVITAGQMRTYLDSRHDELSLTVASFGEQLALRLEARERERLKLRDTPAFVHLVPHVGASVEEYTSAVGHLSSDCYHDEAVFGDPVPADLHGLPEGEYVDMAREALTTWPRTIAGEEFAQRIETLVDLG